MSSATASPARSIAAHAVLIAYTLIALFPVFLIVINSFKSRNAIFRSPLSPADGRDLRPDRLCDGAEAGRFHPLFPEQPDRHRRLAVLRPAVRRDGGLRAVGIPLPRQHADRPLPGARHHDPDPSRHRRDPADHGGERAGQHADRADPGLHRAGPAALRSSSCRSSWAGLGRPQERRAHRRAVGIPHLLPPGAAAGAAGDGDGRGLYHDPDLERSVVPADPGAVGGAPRP